MPERQCISCRRHGEKKNFLRVVRSSGDGVFDPEHRMQGRGAYICQRIDCVLRAMEKSLHSRALQVKVSPSVYQQLADVVCKKEAHLDKLLGFAARAGKVVLGLTAVENASRRGNVRIILLDEEAGSTTKKRVRALSKQHNIPIILKSSGRHIEQIVGKPNCRCIGVHDGGFARSIKEAAELK